MKDGNIPRTGTTPGCISLANLGLDASSPILVSALLHLPQVYILSLHSSHVAQVNVLSPSEFMSMTLANHKLNSSTLKSRKWCAAMFTFSPVSASRSLQCGYDHEP